MYRKAAQKNINLGSIFDARMGSVERQKPSWRVVLVTIYPISAIREKVSKMEGQRTPKTSPKCTFGSSLGRIWEDLVSLFAGLILGECSFGRK